MNTEIKNQQTKNQEVANDNQIDYSKLHYGGFSARFLAQIIDSIIILILFIPIGFAFPDAKQNMPDEVANAYSLNAQGKISNQELAQIATPYLIENVIPKMITYGSIQFLIVGIIFIICWKYKGTTPGKAILGLKIVDATTLKNPNSLQSIMRFFGYILSILTLMFGFTMIMFTKRKQGLHDKLSNTLVIYNKEYNEEWEKKKFKYQTYFFLTILIIMVIIISIK